MPTPKQPTKISPFKPTLSTWIVGFLALLFLTIGTVSSGFSGFLVMAGFIALVTGVYTLATGRKSWAKLPTRKAAILTLTVGLVIAVAGGAIAEPRTDTSSNTPLAHSASAAPSVAAVHFTEGDPGDPATVSTPAETASVFITDNTVTDASAQSLLATIPVKGKAPKTGYNRTGDFGTAWLDVDRNGCDTRNDILSRDLTVTVKSGVCKVMSGQLTDPYTGKTIDFSRGQNTSALVQIDHMVALSNAWQTGAQQLTHAQRISLSNDPLNLMAVDGKANLQKGDGDTATWLPPNKSFRCTYVAHQISVKATYGLWVTPAEHDAMVRVLSNCSDERAFTSAFAPAPAPVVVPEPAPVVVPPPAPAPKPAPAPPVAPGGGATALCKDGSLSFAAHHQGACSHHGGVAVWYK
jgi:hypothetical protein